MLYLGSKGIDHVVSEYCYKETILQRNYEKMAIYGHFPQIPLLNFMDENIQIGVLKGFKETV